ncbi:MAG: GNAT family N-acetyltransferase, partial [Candidatus Eremiobacterota bacterium]
RAFPDRALVFRSLDPEANGPILSALTELGYRAVFARRVYYVRPDDPALFRHRDLRHDLRLERGSPYCSRPPSEAECDRIVRLYSMLYLEKYSTWNPAFTADFVRLCLREELLHLRVLTRNGQPDAVWGCFERNGVMTQPLFGYDTGLPVESGLYRLLSLQVLQEGRRRGVLVNQSAGAGRFKRTRGGRSVPEYAAVYDRHLPLGRRLPWSLVQWLSERVGRPLIEKHEL